MNPQESRAKMLLILVDETDRWDDLPLYEAIIRRLVKHDIAGATALPGIMGYGIHGKIHRRGLFGVSDDRPVAILSVDTEDKLREVIPAIQPMVREGVMFLTDVEVVPISGN
jgi:PII-like signaling protein